MGECCESYPSRRLVLPTRDAFRLALPHVLGLTWRSADLDRGELYVGHQVQRTSRRLHRETKTEESDDFLPLPSVRVKAPRMRRAQQVGNRKTAGDLWQDSMGLVFTTKNGPRSNPATSPGRSPFGLARADLRVLPLPEHSGTRTARSGGVQGPPEGGPTHPPALADRNDDGGLRGDG